MTPVSKQHSSKDRGSAGQSAVAWLTDSHGDRHLQLFTLASPSLQSAVRDSRAELGLGNSNQH